MDPLDLLEKRIAALELQVFPKSKGSAPVDKSQLVTDLLIQAHSMIGTALSCREVITSLLHRMESINDYLSPSYYDDQSQVQEKRQYVLELSHGMSRTMHLLAELGRLKPFLDSPPINNIPALVEKLQKLTLTSVDNYEECKDVTHKILDALQQYNDITTSIKTLFAQLELSVTNMELSVANNTVSVID